MVGGISCSFASVSMVCTAYCLTGRTASGGRACRGVVAVDPRHIPLGTRLYIPGYGFAVARDTGRAIKGHRIDLWIASRGGCRRWGRRRLDVKILTKSQR